MTVSELRREIRAHRGEVFLPVLVPGDVRHIQVTKAAVLEEMRHVGPDDTAPWEPLEDTGQPWELVLDVYSKGER